MLHCINGPNFIVCLPLLLEKLRSVCIVIFYFPVDEVINFETDQSVSLPNQKSQHENLNILRMKKTFQMKLKTCFNIFKRLSLKQEITTFLEGRLTILMKSLFFLQFIFYITECTGRQRETKLCQGQHIFSLKFHDYQSHYFHSNSGKIR